MVVFIFSGVQFTTIKNSETDTSLNGGDTDPDRASIL
jgi:hypothetical protein